MNAKDALAYQEERGLAAWGSPGWQGQVSSSQAPDERGREGGPTREGGR